MENGHSGVEVGFSETRFSSMTLCCTTICKCRTAQLKKKLRARVAASECWPHSTARWSQGHIVFFWATWANGDFDLTFCAVSVPSSVGFSNMWLDVMSTTTVPNLKEIPQ